jgi:hypothetical protein
MNGYYITANNPTEKVPLVPNDRIYLSFRGIIELVLPQCRCVYCYNNSLKELIIPVGCTYVDCRHNYLNKLILSTSCKRVYCVDNKLTQLDIPNDCKEILCGDNLLTKLIIPQDCKVNLTGNNLHPQIKNLLESNNPVKIQLANNLQK